MKNFRIIYIIFLVIIQSCVAQQNMALNFSYQRVSIRDTTINRSFTYNTKSKIYEYKQLYPDGSYKTKTVEINLTSDNIKEINDLYLSLKPKSLCNCLFVENKLIYKSSITFDSNDNKQPKDPICNSSEKDKQNYLLIENKLYDFFSSSFAYREMFPEEFIKR
ncbi:hypothetical protein [Chryseobacterium populi]|uniref:Uncharacterized protein n=1 Tax=Chryseobacterium populi TaxID=1144316 RepID=J3CIA8_9FLAO|nr:hypothetical protein [Chryseobacterium populi]EJL72169.1 hypothetical protein PMI13_02007 [Chryseobacterium populi]